MLKNVVAVLLLAFAASAAAQTRCDELRISMGANLVNCWDFEKPDDALLGDVGAPDAVLRPGVTVDTTMAASGTGSLRFEIISFNEATARKTALTAAEEAQALSLRDRGQRVVSGDAVFDYRGLSDADARAMYLRQLQWTLASQSNTSWWTRNWARQFGPGEEVWVQYRVRENAAWYAGSFGGGGPKKHIIGAGDRVVPFVGSLREALPSSAGKGALIKLASGPSYDALSKYPKNGTVVLEGESIEYFGVNGTENALIISKRLAPVAHGSGAALTMDYLERGIGCPDMELPVTQPWNYLSESYHSCGVKDKQYESHALPLRTIERRNLNGTCPSGTSATPVSAQWCQSVSAYDWIVQSGRKGTWNDATRRWEGGCLDSKVRKGDFSGCVVDSYTGQWVTWTMQIKPGPWYGNDKRYTHAATYRVWKDKELIAEFAPDATHPNPALSAAECAALATSIPNPNLCSTGYDFVRLPYNGVNPSLTGPRTLNDAGGRYGLINIGVQSWRRQYMPYNDPIFCCHPIVTRHFDDLVVASAQIPLPDGTLLVVAPLTATVQGDSVAIQGGTPPYTVTVTDSAGRTTRAQ